MAGKEDDFYHKLRRKIKNWLTTDESKEHKWTEYILAAPDLFYLLWKLSQDENVPSEEKIKLVAAIAYFISPVDLMPELFLGPIGYLDDIAVAAYVLNGLINKTNPEIVHKYWAGETDLLELLQRIIDSTDKMIGSGLWKKLKKVIK
ncbi:DUF1232 domain-containing protein [candidate division KSB1 bacterium]|nr:DUF1232 domain-containing protein [candidate division KSB1 bacterium]